MRFLFRLCDSGINPSKWHESNEQCQKPIGTSPNHGLLQYTVHIVLWVPKLWDNLMSELATGQGIKACPKICPSAFLCAVETTDILWLVGCAKLLIALGPTRERASFESCRILTSNTGPVSQSGKKHWGTAPFDFTRINLGSSMKVRWWSLWFDPPWSPVPRHPQKPWFCS